MMWRTQRFAVRTAQAEVNARHAALAAPAVRLAARIKAHPLAGLGIVAGLGFVLGNLRRPRAAGTGHHDWLRASAFELAALWLRSAEHAPHAAEPAAAPSEPAHE